MEGRESGYEVESVCGVACEGRELGGEIGMNYGAGEGF